MCVLILSSNSHPLSNKASQPQLSVGGNQVFYFLFMVRLPLPAPYVRLTTAFSRLDRKILLQGTTVSIVNFYVTVHIVNLPLPMSISIFIIL